MYEYEYEYEKAFKFSQWNAPRCIRIGIATSIRIVITMYSYCNYNKILGNSHTSASFAIEIHRNVFE